MAPGAVSGISSASISPVSRFLNRKVYRSSPTMSTEYASNVPSSLMENAPSEKNSCPSASTLPSMRICSSAQLDAGRQVGRSPVVFTGDGAPALDGVRLAFHAARVVPPLTHASGHRHVGFLRPRLDLLEDLLAQRLERGRLLVGVRVFGFEVCDYLGVVLVPQPLVVIDERVSVMGTFGRDLLCDRRGSGSCAGTDPIVEGQTGNALVRLDVACTGRVDDLLRQRRRCRVRATVPAGFGAREPVAHELLVETGLYLARFVAFERPVARRVGGEHLVGEHEVSTGVET